MAGHPHPLSSALNLAPWVSLPAGPPKELAARRGPLCANPLGLLAALPSTIRAIVPFLSVPSHLSRPWPVAQASPHYELILVVFNRPRIGSTQPRYSRSTVCRSARPLLPNLLANTARAPASLVVQLAPFLPVDVYFAFWAFPTVPWASKRDIASSRSYPFAKLPVARLRSDAPQRQNAAHLSLTFRSLLPFATPTTLREESQFSSARPSGA